MVYAVYLWFLDEEQNKMLELDHMKSFDNFEDAASFAFKPLNGYDAGVYELRVYSQEYSDDGSYCELNSRDFVASRKFKVELKETNLDIKGMKE